MNHVVIQAVYIVCFWEDNLIIPMRNGIEHEWLAKDQSEANHRMIRHACGNRGAYYGMSGEGHG